MKKQATDHGIVLRKSRLLNNNLSINIFSQHGGKMHLLAYGIRKITSRRLSHLETGNYIVFSFRQDDGRVFLSETELIYGYSQIKDNATKLQKVYRVLQFLNKILPEDEPEEDIFKQTMEYFKRLHSLKKNESLSDEAYFIEVLNKLGYIDAKTSRMASFDVYEFVKELAGVDLR